MDWRQIGEIVSQPDNVPIVGLALVVPFFVWFGWRQARATDRLISELEADPAQAERMKELILTWCLSNRSIILAKSNWTSRASRSPVTASASLSAADRIPRRSDRDRAVAGLGDRDQRAA